MAEEIEMRAITQSHFSTATVTVDAQCVHTHLRTFTNSDCSSVSILVRNLINHMGADCTFVSGAMGVSFTLLVRRTAGRLFH